MSKPDPALEHNHVCSPKFLVLVLQRETRLLHTCRFCVSGSVNVSRMETHSAGADVLLTLESRKRLARKQTIGWAQRSPGGSSGADSGTEHCVPGLQHRGTGEENLEEPQIISTTCEGSPQVLLGHSFTPRICGFGKGAGLCPGLRTGLQTGSVYHFYGQFFGCSLDPRGSD